MSPATYLIRPAVLQDYENLCKVFDPVDQMHAHHHPERFRSVDCGDAWSKEYIQAILENEANFTESN